MTNYSFKSLYINKIKSFIKDSFKAKKVVLDVGKSTVSLFVDEVFKDSDLEIIKISPNRGMNPKEEEARAWCKEAVLKQRADLGIIWDGDGDRVYFLDRKGRVIEPSFVSVMMGRYLRGPIAVDVRSSRVVKDKLEDVRVIKPWHTEIKFYLRQHPEVVFGAETSGHYIFRDFYLIDDGLLAAIIFLQAFDEEELKKMRENYFIIEEKNFSVGSQNQQKEILQNLQEIYQDQGGQIIKIDGLTVEFPDWRFNLRASQTEPVLRLNLEANSEKLMKEKEEEVSSLIKR
jgi:phosphomannomutase